MLACLAAVVRKRGHRVGIRFRPGVSFSAWKQSLAQGRPLRRRRLAGNGTTFLPLVDRGIFAATLGLGVAPPVLMLWALLAYSVTMSLVYGFLEKVSADRGSPVDKRESNDPQRLPEPTCAEAIANFTVGVTCTPHQLIAVAAC